MPFIRAGCNAACANPPQFAGVSIGKRFGHFFESKIEIIGSLILIAIGLKMLIEHLTARGVQLCFVGRNPRSQRLL